MNMDGTDWILHKSANGSRIEYAANVVSKLTDEVEIDVRSSEDSVERDLEFEQRWPAHEKQTVGTREPRKTENRGRYSDSSLGQSSSSCRSRLRSSSTNCSPRGQHDIRCTRPRSGTAPPCNDNHSHGGHVSSQASPQATFIPCLTRASTPSRSCPPHAERTACTGYGCLPRFSTDSRVLLDEGTATSRSKQREAELIFLVNLTLPTVLLNHTLSVQFMKHNIYYDEWGLPPWVYSSAIVNGHEVGLPDGMASNGAIHVVETLISPRPPPKESTPSEKGFQSGTESSEVVSDDWEEWEEWLFDWAASVN